MNPRAVVAGGAGFIGYHFVSRLLGEGFDVVIVDNFATGTRRNAEDCAIEDVCEVVRADICDGIDIAGPVDYVINLACPASPVDFSRIPVEIMRACSAGTNNLLELALHKGAVFLQASTSEVYGNPERHPQQEGYTGNVNITGPRAVYDEGKRYAEALGLAYERKYKMPIRVARIFNTYGPRMRADDGRVVSNFCVQALQDEPLTIYGDGNHTRSFCYVTDMVEALWRLLTSDVTGPVNVGNPDERSMVELADVVLGLTDSDAGTRHLPLPHADDPARRCPDISRAKAQLRWEPVTPLEDGIRETLDWFRELLAVEAPHPLPATAPA